MKYRLPFVSMPCTTLTVNSRRVRNCISSRYSIRSLSFLRVHRHRCVSSLLLFTSLLCLTTFLELSQAIRLVNVTIPSQAVLGSQHHQLFCDYDLETDQLYSLKWYLNGTEMVNLMPHKGEQLALELYPAPGVHIDQTRTTGDIVTLDHVDWSTAGFWRCEISAEAHFQTEQAEKYMQVIVPPDSSPRILGGAFTYDINDIVNVTCVAGYSRPPPLIKWLINDELAPSSYITERPYDSTNEDDENSAQFSSQLHFQVRAQHLMSGKLRLKCITSIRYVSSNIAAADVAERYAEQDFAMNKSASKQPIIESLKSQYYLGEQLNVNCTYPDFTTTDSLVRLQWRLHSTKVHGKHVVRYDHPNIVGLQMVIEPFHLNAKNELVLSCEATKIHSPTTRHISSDTTRHTTYMSLSMFVALLHFYFNL